MRPTAFRHTTHAFVSGAVNPTGVRAHTSINGRPFAILSIIYMNWDVGRAHFAVMALILAASKDVRPMAAKGISANCRSREDKAVNCSVI